MKIKLLMWIFALSILCTTMVVYAFACGNIKIVDRNENVSVGKTVCFKDMAGNKISNLSMGNIDLALGDYYSYDFVIENEGSNDATIAAIETSLGGDGQECLDWTIRRKDNGSRLCEGDSIYSDEKIICTFLLEYSRVPEEYKDLEWYWNISVE